MLKRLRNWFKTTGKRPRSWPEIEEIHAVMDSLDNDALLAKLNGVRVVTNCDCAAQALFVMNGPVLLRRAALTPVLFPGMLEPLFMLGVDEFSVVLNWANALCTRRDLYAGPPSKDCEVWIRTVLPALDGQFAEALRKFRDEVV